MGTLRECSLKACEVWERDHPACNADGTVLRSAFAKGCCEKGCFDIAFNTFIRALGQEPREETAESAGVPDGPVPLSNWQQMEKERDGWKNVAGAYQRGQTAAEEAADKYKGLMWEARHQRDEARERIRKAEAEVARLKARESRDLDAIANGLDRDDTLGASIRRLREENERLKRQQMQEWGVRSVLAEAMFALRCQDVLSLEQYQEAFDRGIAWYRLLAVKGDGQAESGAAPSQSGATDLSGEKVPRNEGGTAQMVATDLADVDAIAEAVWSAGGDMHNARFVARACWGKRQAEKHGTWVPFEIGDMVVLADDNRDLKSAGIPGFEVESIGARVCMHHYEPGQLKLVPPSPPFEPTTFEVPAPAQTVECAHASREDTETNEPGKQPEVPKCGCGACEYHEDSDGDSNYRWLWTHSDGTGHTWIRTGLHCPECRDQLKAPEVTN